MAVFDCRTVNFGRVDIDAWFFVHAYFTIHEFDVSVNDFILITTIFFTPTLLLGCALLKNLLQRVRLELWFRRQTNIPLYASAHSPAVAGYLVDYEFELAEAQAMLIHLHFRGELIIKETPPTDLCLLHVVRVTQQAMSGHSWSDCLRAVIRCT